MCLGAGAINLESRRSSIHSLQDKIHDLLIIGGGITGAGAALEATYRGLTIGLIEQSDFASGTSSKSSKMIHGGLRYMEQLNFRLVREGLKERGLLLHQIAPHLVKPVPFLYLLRRPLWERPYIGLGVFIYDRLGGLCQLPAHQHLGCRETLAVAPDLKPGSYGGSIQFWDAQEDDARYTIFVLRTAVALGALVANRVKAEELLLESGRVVGVKALDQETGESLLIKARHVAVATGPWETFLKQNAIKLPYEPRPSIGVHIVLPRDAIQMDTGLIARTESGLLFVIPWEGVWIVGDTDKEWNGDVSEVVASAKEIQELLDRLNSVLRTAVIPSQIIGVFAGVRPLVSARRGQKTTELSRKHVIASPLPGLTSISGGKYTTYRKMAADLIDTVAKEFRPRGLRNSSTHAMRLVGGEKTAELTSSLSRISRDTGLPVGSIRHLISRYGDFTMSILSLIEEQPELALPLGAGIGVLKAEVVYACRAEGALHIEDVLERRTRIAIQTKDRGSTVVEEVGRLMSAWLGWSEDQLNFEISSYLARTQRELAGLNECLENFRTASRAIPTGSGDL